MAEKDPLTIMMMSKVNIPAISMLMNYSLQIQDHEKVKVCNRDVLELIKIVRQLPPETRETDDYYNKIIIFVQLLNASSNFKAAPIVRVTKNLNQCIQILDRYEANIPLELRKTFIN